MSEVKFEPFQRVLVRDKETEQWLPNLYAYWDENDNVHRTIDEKWWIQCLPYNDETAHLLGTTDSPTPPEPEFKWGDHVEVRDDGIDWQPAIFICKRDEGYMAFIKKATQLCPWHYCRHADW